MKLKSISIIRGIVFLVASLGFLPFGEAASVPPGRPFQELQDLINSLQNSVNNLQNGANDIQNRVTELERTEPLTFALDCATQSINDSLKFLKPGDTLLVSGTCNENVVISSGVRRITLDGQGSATINGPDATEDTVRIGGREITITNFTITGGARGVGVRRGATTLIDSNIIRNTGEQGIVVTQGSVARIVNNAIENNPGTGVLVTENSSVRIGFLVTENTIASPNTIRNNGGDGIVITRSSNAGIVGNTISGNNGNGVLVVRVSQGDISFNAINGNIEHGIFVSQNSGVNLGRDDGTTIFDLPNTTTVNNTLNGIRCLLNSYADGRLGTLNGASGAKNFLFLVPGANSGGCHDSLLP